jgi:hypothetical protein
VLHVKFDAKSLYAVSGAQKKCAKLKLAQGVKLFVVLLFAELLALLPNQTVLRFAKKLNVRGSVKLQLSAQNQNAS